jgi:hypothetical protein
MSVALEEAPPPFMTESQRNYDTVSTRGRIQEGIATE